MNIEETIEELNQRDYGGRMPAHNKAILRLVLKKQLEADEKWAELSTSDYSAADEGMHWSDR